MTLRDDNDNSRAGHTEQRPEKFELLRQSIHELINSEAKASAGLRVGRYGEPALFTEGERKERTLHHRKRPLSPDADQPAS